MLFNWKSSVAMLMTSMAIAKMAKMAFLAKITIIVMADVNFWLA